MRINFDPDQTDPSIIYALINSAVVPRPIAWVSTTSAAGVDNLAPHSYFNVASVRPPMLLFVSLGRKDTLRNIETTGQFVVNVAAEDAFEIVNTTSTEYPESVSEFDLIGVEREASTAVEPTAGCSLAGRIVVIAHPTPARTSTGRLADSTNRTVSSTEARSALAVLTTDRKAA